MYEFVDTNQSSYNLISSIATKIDDVVLDTSIVGFKTLDVTGHEITGQEIDILQDVKDMETGIITNSRFNNKEIRVKFLIFSENQGDHRNAFERLNAILYNSRFYGAKLSFKDNPKWYHFAYFKDIEDLKISPKENKAVGTLVFISPSPFKYSNGRTLYLNNKVSEYQGDGYYQLKGGTTSHPHPFEIDYIYIKNTDKNVDFINFNNQIEIKTEDVFEPRFDDIIIYPNQCKVVNNQGLNISGRISEKSTFDINIKWGNAIYLYPSDLEVEIFYKERML